MKTNKFISLIAIMSALVLATGCVGTREEIDHDGLESNLISVKPRAVAVQLTIPDAPATLVAVTDREDINQVISFALAKSDAGRHDEAAEVFLDAAERFRSKEQVLEQDLVKAAICEHWLAGNINAIREDFQTLSQYQKDIYDTYNEDSTIRKIRRIVTE